MRRRHDYRNAGRFNEYVVFRCFFDCCRVDFFFLFAFPCSRRQYDLCVAVETASKPIEDKMFDGHVDSVIKGLFRALETRGSKDAQTACISLVNISSRPSGLVKVMEFINSDVRPDDRVSFFFFALYRILVGLCLVLILFDYAFPFLGYNIKNSVLY